MIFLHPTAIKEFWTTWKDELVTRLASCLEYKDDILQVQVSHQKQ